MKKSNLLEEEKIMYATCLGILTVSLILFSFLVFNSPAAITGAIVHEADGTGELIDYELGILENRTREEALNLLLQAEKDINEMIKDGFSVGWFNDTLLEAKRYFKGGNYTGLLEKTEELNYTENEKIKVLLAGVEDLRPTNYSLVIEKTEAITKRKAKAYELSDNIKALQLRVDELNSSGSLTVEIEELFNLFKSEFENERYESAEAVLEKINQKLAEGTAESVLLAATYKAGKDNVSNFVKENYTRIIIVLAVTIIISLLFYNKITIRILKKKIDSNEVEINVLEKLMKKAQEDYFSKNTITKKTYEIKTSYYKKRITELKQKTPVLEAKLQTISRIGGLS